MNKYLKDQVYELMSTNLSQSDIARELGISRQRVNQILNPLKHSARYKARKLVRPKKCSRCKKIKALHAHHPDYNKPLDVVWLCSYCHGLEHSQHDLSTKELNSKCARCGLNLKTMTHQSSCS